MRPQQLEMKGFSIFRDRTVIDFSDIELFALVGPTGAGKSTVIDAIVFALYGSVTRYRNAKLVAPVVNQRSNEARVRLDFTIAGVPYTAVRVVRRTKTGATTKEARLEQGDHVLAGSAAELDHAIAELIGLSFDQFNKTVVLPQGEFAQFLTDNATNRQALLRRLLGIELFRSMASSARERARVAGATHDALQEQLATITVSPDDLAVLTARTDALVEMGDEIATEVAARTAAHEAALLAERTANALQADLSALTEIGVPEQTEVLAALIERSDSDLDAARSEADALATELAAAQAQVDSGVDLDKLKAVVAAHEILTTERAALADAEALVHTTAAELDRAEKEQASMQRAVALLDEAVTRTRTRAGAHGLRQSLEIGEPCPVCEQTVEHLPRHDPVEELADLERRQKSAARAAERSAAKLEVAFRADAAARADSNQRNARIEELRVIVDTTEERTAKKNLDGALAITDRLRTAHAAASDALTRLHQATSDRNGLFERLQQQRHAFTTARDRVGSMGPPTPNDVSVHDDWVQLVAWAQEQSAIRQRLLAECDAERRAARDRYEKHDAVLADRCRPFLESGELLPSDPLNWHAAKLARVEEQTKAVRTQLETRAVIEERLNAFESDHSVAAMLGQLLGASAFEQWLMEDAMASLADRATTRLIELSGGAYSLVVDGADFAVRDHHNADEIRAARTLSGGETFLASLSLALALADSVSEMASTTAPVVESMFLDEGFGTLDAETLDVVASAIEELGASGRMIGIVTHIAELADRLPARFEVRRTAGSSTVTRSDV